MQAISYPSYDTLKLREKQDVWVLNFFLVNMFNSRKILWLDCQDKGISYTILD